jgi:signal transduction histidine kinase
MAKAKSTFFASMSHELRNPLNALLGSVDLLEASENAYMYDEEVLTTAKICGETLLNLIGNVLDASKIEAKKFILAPEPAYLKETLLKAAKMASMTAKHKGLFIKSFIDSSIPECLSFDSQKLMQVLINITGNAIKFTDKGGIFIKAEWIPVFQRDQTELILNDILSFSMRKYYVENSQG